MVETFEGFFERLTGQKPLPYQSRYAADRAKLTLMIAPTGMGKTYAVTVPWLYAIAAGEPTNPKRQFIVLPRQNLTEQTFDVVSGLVERAGLNGVRVLQLMGGSGDNDQTLRPEQNAIIVCTQDMYLSRALNRGYARKPPRWPIDFALVNNDCHVVLDEVQLMSDGLATSAQLAAFREGFGTFGGWRCTWMSATVQREWLDTVDLKAQSERVRTVKLDTADLEVSLVKKRYWAKKQLQKAPKECSSPKGCADFVLEQHSPGTRTLIVVNTVARAREVYSQLKDSKAKTLLIHSRFRPSDRERKMQELQEVPEEGLIVVATQVVEAGVDISARVLVTDLAPWASLVQRFGRVNRYGTDDGAAVWWVEEPLSSKTAKEKKPEAVYAPYDTSDVDKSKARLEQLQSASPADLSTVESIIHGEPAPWKHVLRRADLVDLFDTSPDLSGNSVDVSRFIRSGNDRDVHVVWRRWEGEPTEEMVEISDAELCPAPINEIREFGRNREMWTWSYAEERWKKIDSKQGDGERLYPGMVLLTRAECGGYTPERGWDPESGTEVDPAGQRQEVSETDSGDSSSIGRRLRQTLVEHTDEVVAELHRILEKLSSDLTPWKRDLEAAVKKHDWGKAHEVMQETLGQKEGEDLLAKSVERRKHRVKHFRHELASALAMIECGDSDLAAYLAGAHHGKIRLSIRSMPGEKQGRVRGIRDGDELRGGGVATGLVLPGMRLRLDLLQLGWTTEDRRSWTDRMLRLRDELGPFRLGYLEMLVRAADEGASAKAGEVGA